MRDSAPFTVGESLVDDATVVDVVGHLRLELHVKTPAGVVVVEVVPRSADTPHAAQTADYLIAWRAEHEADERAAERLCQAVAQRLNGMTHPFVSPEVGVHVEAKGSRVRRVTGGAILTPAGAQTAQFWALEPYVGCLVGCQFCYAQTRLQAWRAAEGLRSAQWGTWVDARVDAADALARDLQALPPRPIKFTPVRADPYHAIESQLMLTRACLEVLAQRPPPATIVLTRCALVDRDLELLAGIDNALLGFSLPTMDDQVRRHFEPKAAATHRRFEILRRAGALGVETFAVVQPMLPGKAERLADLLAATVDSVALDTLHGTHGAAEDFAAAGFEMAADAAWQRDRLAEMIELLSDRGVPIWSGELPPSARRAAAM
jgi:DNA repair photolyase